MKKRVLVGALGAAMVALTGCGDNNNENVECRSSSDCTGTPAAGNQFVCESNQCVQRPVSPAPTPDAGPGTPDAGPDAGPVDGGGNLTEGQPCSASSQCGPGLRCETTCQPMHLAFTTTTGPSFDDRRAAAVRFNKNEAPVLLPQPDGGSFWPRWSPAGDRVAVVEGRAAVTGTTPAPASYALVTYPWPLTTAPSTLLLTAGDPSVGPAYSENFFNLEWAPGKQIAFSRAGNVSSIAGIVLVPPEGGQAQDATPGGSFPSFNGDGSKIAFSASGQGLIVIPAAQPFSPVQPVEGAKSGTEHEPFFNAAGDALLFLKQVGKVVFNGNGDTSDTEISSLYVIPAAGGTAQPVAEAVQGAPDAEGRSRSSYVSMHNFSADGRLAAYVRVNYSTYQKPAEPPATDGGTPDVDAGTPDAGPPATVTTNQLCGSTNPVCPNTEPNDVYVARLNPDGTRAGDELLLAAGATQPSISPDGRFVAYVSGGVLTVQQIDPNATSAATLKVGAAIRHTATSSSGRSVVTGGADDVRPRWQPK